MQRHQVCLICGSGKLSEMPEYKSSYLCKCDACGFVFAEKIPTEKELEDHYEGYGRNDYLSPITIKRYNELLDSFEKYRKTNRLIDVGCGIGYFLDEAIKRGWEVFGTEYTDEAIEICEKKGIKMLKGKLDPSKFKELEFDVVTSFEVIEHINNPLEELSNFNKMLRNGGLVYITTPNFNSLLRYRLKSAYNVITYPEHLSYYTPKTLAKVFKENGFSKDKVLTTGFSLTRLRTSKGTKEQEYISKSSDDEVLRNQIENKKHLQLAKSMINGSLTLVGKGDTLKGYFIKN